MQLPRILELVLCDILQHTAHHVDAKVPLYQLSLSQKSLENAFPEIVHEPFSVRRLFAIAKTCQLFDYREHRWLSFDGTPTTPPLLK